MKEYFKQFIGLFWEKDISILYTIFGFLMFIASVVQIEDPAGKCDPSIENPYLIVYTCTILGFLTILISPLSNWFIIRNATMGFSFFLSIYIIVDAWENITNSANGVWFVAMCVYAFLLARSYKDLIKSKEKYIKPKRDKC